MLSLAVEWGWLKRNPAAGRLKLPTGQVREKVVWTPQQFWKLTGELRPPYRTLVVLAVLSSLRRGELAALRQEDFTGDAVVVDEAVYRGCLGDPKTPKSRRRVVVGPLVEASRRNVPVDLHHVVARHIQPARWCAGAVAVEGVRRESLGR